MKINLTKKDYKTLLKAVYISSWMAGIIEDDSAQEIEALEQHILSHANEFAFDKYVGYDEETKKYYPTEKFEDDTGIVDAIDQYNQYTVWEALILALARRDLIEKYGEEALEQMDDEERVEKEIPIIEEYEAEFRDNGFTNLVIKKAGKAGKAKKV